MSNPCLHFTDAQFEKLNQVKLRDVPTVSLVTQSGFKIPSRSGLNQSASIQSENMFQSVAITRMVCSIRDVIRAKGSACHSVASFRDPSGTNASHMTNWCSSLDSLAGLASKILTFALDTKFDGIEFEISSSSDVSFNLQLESILNLICRIREYHPRLMLGVVLHHEDTTKLSAMDIQNHETLGAIDYVILTGEGKHASGRCSLICALKFMSDIKSNGVYYGRVFTEKRAHNYDPDSGSCIDLSTIDESDYVKITPDTKTDLIHEDGCIINENSKLSVRDVCVSMLRRRNAAAVVCVAGICVYDSFSDVPGFRMTRSALGDEGAVSVLTPPGSPRDKRQRTTSAEAMQRIAYESVNVNKQVMVADCPNCHCNSARVRQGLNAHSTTWISEHIERNACLQPRSANSSPSAKRGKKRGQSKNY